MFLVLVNQEIKNIDDYFHSLSVFYLTYKLEVYKNMLIDGHFYSILILPLQIQLGSKDIIRININCFFDPKNDK